MKHRTYPKDKIQMDEDDIKVSQTYWEYLCGSCDNFNTDECPFKNIVSDTNNWKTEIRCDKYWN